MSFKENAYQQMSFADSFSGLTVREQKTLEKSWSKVFADEIFPAIDEKRFSVLYSDKASRLNTPVNVIVGVLIIKELFAYFIEKLNSRTSTHKVTKNELKKQEINYEQEKSYIVIFRRLGWDIPASSIGTI